MNPADPFAIERKAAEHGINVYRTLLEDENEHPEDALRVGMLSAISEALRLRLPYESR